MAASEQTVKVSNAGGRLRVELPAAIIEAEDAEALIVQVKHHSQTTYDQVLRFLLEFVALNEDIALRELENRCPGLDVLERFAARHPAPQQWYDEPE